jgi:murein DD-endopeptidase MepM/ murein hydrolase activator NlpD
LEKTAINRYRLPVPKTLLERVDRTSSPAHTGKLRNAIDFIVAENTPVLAAANGIVTYVNDDSSIGGANPIYWNFTNFIVIMHANEEYSRYDHLAPQSSKVKVGQAVSEGEEIAKVGVTGYTFHPHFTFSFYFYWK